MASPGEHHPAFEEYCECIYELLEENVEVIQARIVERLQVSRPSVSEMMKRMEAEGLVALSGSSIALTETGEKLALRTVRRHRIAERFLTDILGLSWAHAHHEAGRWEHVMSAEVETAMDRVLGNPTTCPHGNPIPGSSYRQERLSPLSDVLEGKLFTVNRIPEELEFAPGILEILEQANLKPGHSGTIVTSNKDGSRVVRVDDNDVALDEFTSSRILVLA
jgi:DtxR family Mn-dependent transcriptional regulator